MIEDLSELSPEAAFMRSLRVKTEYTNIYNFFALACYEVADRTKEPLTWDQIYEYYMHIDHVIENN